MEHGAKLSRRQVLRVGAVTGSTVALVAVVGESASAAPADTSRQARSRGELGRVSSTTGGRGVVGTPKQTNLKKVGSPERAPFAGFPDGVTPRPGDLVTLTDDWDGLALAAVPVVHWIEGVPKRLPDGGYLLAGERVAPSARLENRTSKRVRVCVLDTELPDSQVLEVRAA